MINTNGLFNPKVIRIILPLLLITLSLNSVAMDYKSRRQHWVDSVYHALNMEQRVKQLLFPVVSRPTEMPTGVGGIVLQGNYSGRISSLDELPVLVGLIPQADMFSSVLGVDLGMLAATWNEELYEQAGDLGSRILSSSGNHFLFQPGRYLSTRETNLGEGIHLDPVVKGMSKNGFGTWSDGGSTPAAADAQELVSYLSRYEIDFSKLKKKDLKKLRKIGRQKPLLFYETTHNDLNLASAILASDVLVFEGSDQFYVNQINDLIASKKLKRRSFEEKVRKVLATKFELLSYQLRPPHEGERKKFLREVYEQGTVLVKNEHRILPVGKIDDRTFASVSFGVYESDPFSETLGSYTQFQHFGEPDYLHDDQKLMQQLAHYDFIVAGFSFPDNVDLNNADVQRRIAFLEELAQHTNVITVIFAEGKWLKHWQNVDAVLWMQNNKGDAQEVAPQLIFGALPIRGRLPYDISPDLPHGHGIMEESLSRLRYSFPEYEGFDQNIERKIDIIVKTAIENLATPGCQVLVARRGNVVLNKGYGYFTYDSLQQVTDQTLYDLASVTKVTGTLQATMFLNGQKDFELDSNISVYLTELAGSNKEHLKIRDILAHQAGLQSYFPFYKKTYRGDRLNPQYIHLTQESQYNQRISPGLFGHRALEDSVWNWTINSRLRKKPDWRSGYDYKYSDLGFLMMFMLNERLINQPMEDFLAQNFYEPLGMTSTGYQPTCRFPIDRIAPTEVDYDFRNTLIWGNVHDENAAITGGVGGHAGLFSTANDLAKLLQMNLQDGQYGGIEYIRPGTISAFTRKQFPGNRRGLGWDRPAIGSYQNTARKSSWKTFGHLGFTGTAVWVDPEYELIYVFLSNRVYPNRENDKLMVEKIRSRIHEVIYESMPEFSGD